jgi:tetratricopeptide (TPR) repeat protein
MAKYRIALLGLGLLLASARFLAIHIPLETRRVPIDRLTANLEREVKAHPSDVQTLVNLARVHAMAYALKIDDFPTMPPQDKRGGTEVPYFPPGPRTPRTVRAAPSTEHAAQAARHLDAATRHYAAAIELAPDNITALIGYGWVLQQGQQREQATAAYRRVIQLAWPQDQKVRALMPYQEFVTAEAIGYLIPLLDPARDAAEIKDLLAKKQEMDAKPRAITPVAVPLGDNVGPDAIVDRRARVRFDADGSGLDREWTWITPRAGWLVYDADGRGTITSALQLFGTVTFWLFWRDGYDALGALDDDGDGRLEGVELRHLAIWHDRDSDGVADAGEVGSLAQHGIVSVSCASEAGDGRRFAAVSPQGVRFADGRTRPTYDVILHRAASTLTRR